MSNLSEIKQHLSRMAVLSNKMKEQLEKLRGPEGVELREKAKEQGKRIGIGAGIAAFGIFVLIGGAMYINGLLIILLDLAMPLWVAALIVVLGMLLFGGIVTGVGIGIARKSAKNLPHVGGDVVQSLKEASDEMKQTMEELQNVAKQEADDRKKQAKDLMETIKPMVPYLIGAYVGYRVMKRVLRSRKTRRIVLEEWVED